jgi:hypothetical protein
MNSNFNEMTWHDAELLNIGIDRSNPGENDQVIIDICWQNGEKSKLVFDDCYELEAKMNFGVIAPESILQAVSVNESQKLTEIRKKWTQVGVDLEHLRCFEIQTNTTSSVIRIYATNCTFHPSP